MCVSHWLAVPKAQRTDVNRTWRAYKRSRAAEPADYQEQHENLAAYRDARDAAIKTVAESELPCLP